MYQRYQPQTQRPKAREQALFESLARGELDVLADRRVPLPDGMKKSREIEETIRSLSKVLLGRMDAIFGLDGSMPMRGRW